jgi:hypothetical protein
MQGEGCKGSAKGGEVMNIIAICKDCGNGTLNGRLNPQFGGTELEGGEIMVDCLNCGSTHVDAVSVDFDEQVEELEAYHGAVTEEDLDKEDILDPYDDGPYEREVGA